MNRFTGFSNRAIGRFIPEFQPFLASPTSRFRETNLFCIKEMGVLLVTIGGFGPYVSGLDRLRLDAEPVVERVHIGIWSCGPSDA